MPSFLDLIRADLDYVLSDGFSEDIDFKALDGLSESLAPWKSVRAAVDRNAEPLGISADIGRQPVIVVISKTELDSVTKGRDMIRLSNGSTYRVEDILSDDIQGWELYCL